MTAVYLALISLVCYSSKRILQRLNTPAAFTNFIGLAFYRETTVTFFTKQPVKVNKVTDYLTDSD